MATSRGSGRTNQRRALIVSTFGIKVIPVQIARFPGTIDGFIIGRGAGVAIARVSVSTSSVMTRRLERLGLGVRRVAVKEGLHAVARVAGEMVVSRSDRPVLNQGVVSGSVCLRDLPIHVVVVGVIRKLHAAFARDAVGTISNPTATTSQLVRLARHRGRARCSRVVSRWPRRIRIGRVRFIDKGLVRI